MPNSKGMNTDQAITHWELECQLRRPGYAQG